jgi:hypothetical protein
MGSGPPHTRRLPPLHNQVAPHNTHVRCDVRVGVDVQLQDAHSAAHLLGHRLQLACQQQAGPAPGGVEVDDHGPVPRVEGGFQGFSCDVLDLHAFACHLFLACGAFSEKCGRECVGWGCACALLGPRTSKGRVRV